MTNTAVVSPSLGTCTNVRREPRSVLAAPDAHAKPWISDRMWMWLRSYAVYVVVLFSCTAASTKPDSRGVHARGVHIWSRGVHIWIFAETPCSSTVHFEVEPSDSVLAVKEQYQRRVGTWVCPADLLCRKIARGQSHAGRLQHTEGIFITSFRGSSLQ